MFSAGAPAAFAGGPPSTLELIRELRGFIEASRGRVAQAINGELVLLYWQVGRRLREEVVGEGRSAYGEQVVQTVAASLSAEYGAGFGKRSLYRMMRFAEVFLGLEIVHALRSQLGWTHLRALIAIEDPLQRSWASCASSTGAGRCETE